MLDKYYQSNSSSFTKLVLAEALIKAGLLAIAESHHLLEIFKPDEVQEGNHNYTQNTSTPGKK